MRQHDIVPRSRVRRFVHGTRREIKTKIVVSVHLWQTISPSLLARDFRHFPRDLKPNKPHSKCGIVLRRTYRNVAGATLPNASRKQMGADSSAKTRARGQNSVGFSGDDELAIALCMMHDELKEKLALSTEQWQFVARYESLFSLARVYDILPLAVSPVLVKKEFIKKSMGLKRGGGIALANQLARPSPWSCMSVEFRIRWSKYMSLYRSNQEIHARSSQCREEDTGGGDTEQYEDTEQITNKTQVDPS